MTVATTLSRVAYTGDGVTVAFAVPFPFFDPADLVVIERTIADGAEIVKALNVDYTVAGGGGSTGTVTAGVAPASTKQWAILRATPLTQLIDYVSNDGFPAETHEAGLDRAAMRDQEVQEKLGRALTYPPGDPAGLSAELPSSVDRAGKVLGFDVNGNPVPVVDIPAGSIVLPLPIGDGGTGSTTASGARTALAAAGTGDANVFTATQTIRSSDAGAGVGPELVLDRASASPAASDVLGAIRFDGKDGAANAETYARIEAGIVDAANASEDGIIAILTKVAGTLARRFLVGAGLYDTGATGGDPGAGWVNVSGGYKVNNVAIGGVPAGVVVQRTHTRFTTYDSTTSVIPFDDTVPQSGEGKAINLNGTGNHAHTPLAAGNKLLVRAVIPVGHSNNGHAVVAALFKDGDASALAADAFHPYDGGGTVGEGQIVLEYEMTAPNTTPINFKLRYGTENAATTAAINGSSAGRQLGGAKAVTVTVEELKV